MSGHEEFRQPGEYVPRRAKRMDADARRTADKLKDVYRRYLEASHERSKQLALGPSEVGTACDRRLAMKLAGVPSSSGDDGDGWAAFVGTMVHEGLARAFLWDNENRASRWLVEKEVHTGHPLVPKGTADLYDLEDKEVIDHKVVGDYSLQKMKREGVSPEYRVQLHVYGLAYTLMGYDVNWVSLAAWPKAQSSLSSMYVVREAFDPSVAQAAISPRLSRIAEILDSSTGTPLQRAMLIPGDTNACRWCNYKSTDPSRGCPGDG